MTAHPMDSYVHAVPGGALRAGSGRRAWLAYTSLPCLMYIAIWLGNDSGPWVLAEPPESFLEYAHYVRTLFPFVAILALPFMVSGVGPRMPTPSAFKWWLAYGFAGCVGCLLSPQPIDALYWIGCHLSVFAVVYGQMHEPDPLESLARMNRVGWFVASVFLVIMIYLARDALAGAAMQSGSFYGAYGRMDTVADMAMSRSSGLARFTAIPAIVTFVWLWRGRLVMRVFGMAVAAAGFWFIWELQSRGAIFALAGTVILSMLILGTRARLVLVALVVGVLIVWSARIITPEAVQDIEDYILRGQDTREFATMTGRTDVWAAGLEAAAHSPVFGYGPQSDRFILDEHIHNAYLYALLQGGVIGLAAFSGGLIMTWSTIFQLSRNQRLRQDARFTPFVQTSALLIFFSIRGITEVSGAMFAVDLMIMVPAVAYLGILRQTIDLEAASPIVQRVLP